jgi:hypothetical protein
LPRLSLLTELSEETEFDSKTNVQNSVSVTVRRE